MQESHLYMVKVSYRLSGYTTVSAQSKEDAYKQVQESIKDGDCLQLIDEEYGNYRVDKNIIQLK